MRDQQIIEGDLRVRRACQAETLSFATSFSKEINKIKTQLQNASNVAIDNHARLLAIRQVLESPRPLFTVIGISVGRRFPRNEDIDAAYAQIKSRFSAVAKQKPDPEADAHGEMPNQHAASTVEKPCA